MTLARFTSGKKEVKLKGATVKQVIAALEKKHPDLRGKLLDANGDVKKFLKVFVNKTDASILGGGDAKVSDGDEITLVPAGLGG